MTRTGHPEFILRSSANPEEDVEMNLLAECSAGKFNLTSFVILNPFQDQIYHLLVMKDHFVYILTNNSKTLYIGLTNNLVRRIYEHRNKLIEGFTKKYNLNTLVYFEIYNSIETAIRREKQLKN